MNDLCERLATNLDVAFPDLVTAMQHQLYSGLVRLYGSEAEDLTQETFIRVYRALAGYDSDRISVLNLRGWVWTIALNLGRNHVRDRSRRPIPVDFSDEPIALDPEPVDPATWNHRLAQLPLAQRRAVVLRHVVGMSYDELAEATGRPTGTVKADVHRGLERLKSIINKEGLDQEGFEQEAS